jgi:small conductance mechanosensitive channel
VEEMAFDVMDVFNWKIPYIDLSILELIVAVVITLIAYVVLMVVVLPYVGKAFARMKLPELLVGLLLRVIRVLLIVVVLLVFLSAIKIDVGSIVLALAAVLGLIIAFGMADSFNNFFGGTWIAMLRPFKKGDVVTINGMTGSVGAVGIMATELLTPDNVFITIPNKLVWGSPLVNMSRMNTRRVGVDVGIAYGSDVRVAYDVAMKVMQGHAKVLKEPAPAVVITELAGSSVNLQLRAWTATGDYWGVLDDLRRAVLVELPMAGIEIPFPQLDVHFRNEAAAAAVGALSGM